MRKILFLLFLSINMIAAAQKKAPSVALHYSFTDFRTAMAIKANSVGYVLKNKLWSNFPAMDAGYGISYWQGLTRNLDLSAGLNYTKSIYTFPVSTYTITKKLVTLEASGIYKFLAEDKTAVTPYLSAGAGLYTNDGKTGFYAPVGLGLHANLWNEAFVFAGADYRITFKNNDNKSFLYKVGVGTHLFRKKEKRPTPVLPPPVVIAEKQPVTRDIAIWVKDEATGQPLPDVEVKLNGTNGKIFEGKTDIDGKLHFAGVVQADYTVRGTLNNITTESKKLEAGMFEGKEASINLVLLHNDPRFTLVGKAVEKKAGNPVSEVEVSVNNSTRASLQMVRSGADGLFKAQLEPASDFSIAGKKAGYFSNIEQLSTKGLNRSTTLYVKLELEIQEAKQGQQIVLNKIFFETNKATLNTAASTDLNRLVKYLADNPSARLEIQGHTDNTGSATINKKLSQSRAVSVLNYLTTQGISSARLVAKGYGSSQPIDSNTTVAGRANNRRVEIKILGE